MNGVWGNEVTSDIAMPCQHAIAEDEDGEAVCAYCGKDFGWYCHVSTKHFCEYTDDDEWCIHCGAPEERQ